MRAVYIRDVAARGRERAEEVAAMAETGGHLVLAADSIAIAEDAARLGLISAEQLEGIEHRVEERLR